MKLNVHCGCGFRFGTDGIDLVDKVEVERLIELIQKDNVRGPALVINAAVKHAEQTGHTMEVRGEVRGTPSALAVTGGL